MNVKVMAAVGDTINIARREVERHKKQFIGLTASAPRFVDQNGLLEWVCDVRVGTSLDAEIVKDVRIAMPQPGLVNDINVPVVVERSETGRLSVIARSEVRLPDIRITSYTLNDLGFLFMTLLEQDSEGVWRDGFGHEMTSPVSAGTTVGYTWDCALDTMDEVDIDSDGFWDSTSQWLQQSG